MLTPLDFPDEIWTRLKTWAKAQASSADPSLEECESYVRHICSEITGKPDALHAEVRAFYAAEALEMIAKYRATINAEGGVA